MIQTGEKGLGMKTREGRSLLKVFESKHEGGRGVRLKLKRGLARGNGEHRADQFPLILGTAMYKSFCIRRVLERHKRKHGHPRRDGEGGGQKQGSPHQNFCGQGKGAELRK